MSRHHDIHDESSDAAAWAVILAVFASVAVLEWRRPLGVDPAGLMTLAIAVAALAGAATFYGTVRPRENFAAMCGSLLQVLVFSTAGSLLSYLIAREGGVLWDSTFRAWDQALGLDWLAYVRWVDRHPLVATLLRMAYASLIPQMIAIILVLGFTRRTVELRTVMLAAMLAGTLTVLLSPIFPAVSNFVALHLTAADFRHIDPWAGYVHLEHFSGLRDGSLAAIRISDLQGIITFPSYHAALATVTCWGFWKSRIAAVRMAGCSVALATIAATPVDGGHYFVDVLAGAVLATISIAIARKAVRWPGPALTIRALPFRRSRAAFGQ